MSLPEFSKILRIVAAAAVVTASGCATSLVRSKNALEPDHVFPATSFDARFFWNAGVKGEPLFATVDPKEKNSPLARLAYGAGAIIDLPFSIAFDTILLPVDLIHLETSAANEGAEGE